MEEATCQRIIKKINHIIFADKQLDEFDLVTSSGETNRSPIIQVEHKMALESWCVKHVYSFAYKRILRNKTAFNFNEACALVEWTQFCLLIAPEVSTFWNIRKQLLRKSVVSPEADLQLTTIALSRKPKCMEIYQQRRWIYTNILYKQGVQNGSCNGEQGAGNNNNVLPNASNNKQQFLLSELEICTWTANKHPNNYHSWNHRLWVMQELTVIIGLIALFKQEYETNHSWISTHVSEHSGLHYMQYLLDSLTTAIQSNNIQVQQVFPEMLSIHEVYIRELNFNSDLIFSYPDHEALFCHRRFLLIRLRDIIGNTSHRTSSPPPALKRSCVESLSSEWSAILLEERQCIAKCLKSSSYQKCLGEKHTQWLNNVLAL